VSFFSPVFDPENLQDSILQNVVSSIRSMITDNSQNLIDITIKNVGWSPTPPFFLSSRGPIQTAEVNSEVEFRIGTLGETPDLLGFAEWLKDFNRNSFILPGCEDHVDETYHELLEIAKSTPLSNGIYLPFEAQGLNGETIGVLRIEKELDCGTSLVNLFVAGEPSLLRAGGILRRRMAWEAKRCAYSVSSDLAKIICLRARGR
jgi:hypothetical protein